MHKENRGFTLLELIISIAVLSIMAGVLFQAFVVSRRIDTKAAKEERVQNLAKGVMEDMKGVVFGDLGETADGGEEDGGEVGDSGTVVIGGHEYTYETLSGADGEAEGADSAPGYLLKREQRTSAAPDVKVDYLIEVEADAKRYKSAAEEDSDSSYSINRYRMPNIADVSSFQNVVISPDMMIRDDVIKVSELLEKVNPEEEESGADGEPTEAAAETVYDEDDVKKTLRIDLMEQKTLENDSRLLAGAYGIYTVDQVTDSMEAIDEAFSITFPIASFKKQVTLDKKTGNPLNRIYLFLPAETAVEFEKIYVNSDIENNKKYLYELYVIVSEESTAGKTEESYIKLQEKTPSAIHLLTNLETNNPVSLYDAQNHLYRLRVTVYEADYGAGDSAAPVKGKALLTIDSTKSE